MRVMNSVDAALDVPVPRKKGRLLLATRVCCMLGTSEVDVEKFKFNAQVGEPHVFHEAKLCMRANDINL